MRKLKARVEELERMRSKMQLYEMERRSTGELQGEAPRVGAGVDTSVLNGYSQEELWHFMRKRLMMEQENGELRGWHTTSTLSPLHGPGRGEHQNCEPILLLGKLTPGDNCPRSHNWHILESYH